MKKASSLFVAGAAAALLPLTVAMAQSPAPDQTDPPAQTAPSQGGGTTFESLDANSDGRISKAEAEANANVKAQFASYDLNGDGFIERAEVNQSNGQQSPSPQQ